MDEKRLREAVAKVREGSAVFVKNVSGCKIDRDKVKLYRLKSGEELLVDKKLDTHLLDRMNENKNIDVETVCSGHTGESPTVGFNYKGKLPISEVKNILATMPDTKITYDSQVVRIAVPFKDEFKIKRDGEEFTLCSIENVHQDYFFIRGIRKSNKTWWNKVSNTLSRLK